MNKCSSINFEFAIVVIVIVCAPLIVSSRFELDTSWPHRSVSDLPYYGSGIVLDNHSNVIVLHRGHSMMPGAPENQTILEDVIVIVDGIIGTSLGTWGQGIFRRPHGIAITQNGDIFITDLIYHQFEWISAEKLWNKKPVLTLGERFVSASNTNHFCSPADVAVVPGSGEFFVADGYCNSRVIKFDRTGKYLLEFSAGSVNTGIPSVQFSIPHALALTQVISKDEYLVFVADRNNGRIQCFNSNGIFLYEINSAYGLKAWIFSLAYTESNSSSGLLYAVNGNLPWGQSEIFQLPVDASSAKLLAAFQVNPTSSLIGSNLTSNDLEIPHDMTISSDGKQIFVIIANKNYLILKKFKLVNENDMLGVSCASSLITGFHMSILTVTVAMTMYLQYCFRYE